MILTLTEYQTTFQITINLFYAKSLKKICNSFVKDPQCNFLLLDETYCKTHRKLTP